VTSWQRCSATTRLTRARLRASRDPRNFSFHANVQAVGERTIAESTIIDIVRAALREPTPQRTSDDPEALIRTSIEEAWHETPVDPDTGLHDLSALETHPHAETITELGALDSHHPPDQHDVHTPDPFETAHEPPPTAHDDHYSDPHHTDL
jgi:hypothetical protein